MRKWTTIKVVLGLSVLLSTAVYAKSKNDDGRERYSWTLGYAPDKVIEFYRPEPNVDLKLDLFFPADHTVDDKRPCILFFFGGGWMGGQTAQFYGISKYLASRGMVAIAAEYRTKNRHEAVPRNCVEDGRQAVRYVRQHAAALGINPAKIAAGGGSAGGHVAAAVAMCPKIDAKPESTISSMPNALVLFNPVYNNGPEGYGHSRVTEYWQDISPYHNIREGLPPTIVFFGTDDNCVPVEQVNAFQEAMAKAGNDCSTHIYDDEKHGFFHISKGGRKMFEDVLTKADAFLQQHGLLSGADQVKPWTAQAIEHYKESPDAKRLQTRQGRKKTGEGKKGQNKEAVPTKAPAKTESASYPWQNYSGPLKQNYFEMRDGLKNSQYIFETTKRGTVAFVGGSITGMSWRKKVAANLEKRFPSTKFNFILAGVGSTGTMYGSYRIDRDVIQKGLVDLIFEEAAVNDLAVGRTADQSVRGMEGIVRHARRANPNVDIVMMHFACPDKIQNYKDGKTPQVIASFDKVAEQYGVPTLDLTREIFERIERSEITWAKDIVGLHPSPFGQQLYADGIERLLDEAWSGAPTPVKPHPMPAKVDEASYDQGQLFPPQTAVNCNGFNIDTAYDAKADGGKIRTGWNELPQLVGTKPGDSFELTFRGSAAAIMVIAGPKAGIVEHSIDGSDWVKQDLFTKHSPKLHLQRIYMLRDGLDPEKEHLLKVRVADERNALSVGNNCRIVYFGINGDPRKPRNINVDGIYFEGSDGHGPEK